MAEGLCPYAWDRKSGYGSLRFAGRLVLEPACFALDEIVLDLTGFWSA